MTFRDSDIDNYVQAAEALTELGYFVIRMGVEVNKKILSKNPKYLIMHQVG